MKREQNFYWEVINPQKAIEIYKSGTEDLFKLFDDDTESMIISEKDLHDTIDLGIEMGIQKIVF